MKLSLYVTLPMPRQMAVTGMAMSSDVGGVFAPGQVISFPESDPAHTLVETYADGMPAEAVVAVLRAAADEVERYAAATSGDPR